MIDGQETNRTGSCPPRRTWLRQPGSAVTACLLALLLLLSVLAGAQATPQVAPAAKATEQRPKRPEDVLDLVARTKAVPPEFGADVLNRVASSGRVTDPVWKRELLEEAFYLAANTTEPVRRTLLKPMHDGNSRSNYRAQGFNFNLDTLSLQGRTVQALLPVDAKAALKLLRSVRMPQLPALTCDDVFGYMPDDFYTDTVSEVAQRAFLPEEVRRADNITLIEDFVKDLQSPAQIEPIAALIAETKTTPEHLSRLVTLFSALLSGLPSDPRTGLGQYGFGGMRQLAEFCRKAGVPRQPLLAAYRAYQVRRLSQRCSDTAEWDWRSRGSAVPVGDTRQEVEAAAREVDVPPIDLKAIEVQVIEAHIDEPPFWRDPVAKQLLTTINELRGRADLRADQAQWNARFMDFVGQLESWTGTSEKSEADYFHQKALLLQGAFSAAPRGQLRSSLLRSWVIFLALSGVKHSSPIEWYVQANPIIQMAMSPKPDERAEALSVIYDSRDPVLVLYAELARVLSKPPAN